MLPELEAVVTRRRISLLQEDVEICRGRLQEAFQDRRIAIIGAAGSVGSAVAKRLLMYLPAAISLLDLNENNLAELVRDLRSADGIRVPRNFAAIAIGLGSVEFSRYFREVAPFDYIFNLSAVKHVRSEKNVYSLIRMIDTNVVFVHEFLQDLTYPVRKFFSVSSDKATNPASLMGASKMVMEEVLLMHAGRHPVSSARFANVAFSDGSLPFSFLRRIEKRQPLSAPEDVRRYFITHEEAGDLCLLSAALGENRNVFFPKMDEQKHTASFPEIAVHLLRHYGYEPVVCRSEKEAKARASELIPQKKWPCYFFRSDTTGEKEKEEFFLATDEVDWERFRTIGVIERSAGESKTRAAQEFLEFAAKMKREPGITKADVVAAFRRIVPELDHIETGRNLDDKM